MICAHTIHVADSQFSPLSRHRADLAIPGKRVWCLWGQFGMRASPYAPSNINGFTLGRTLKKIIILSKKLQTKVIWNWIACKKFLRSVSLSLPGVELRDSKYCHFWHNVLERESRSFLGLNTAKNRIISKNSLATSYSELDFLQKTEWTHVSISSGAELGKSKNHHFWNILMQWNRKVGALRGWKQQNIPIIYRKMLQTKGAQN